MSISPTDSPEGKLEALAKDCSDLGLNFERIKLHQSKLLGAIKERSKPRVVIEDTCRLDNDGIMTLDKLASFRAKGTTDLSTTAAFIPAAGAASRYFKPLAPFVEALRSKNSANFLRAGQQLIGEGALNWPIPDVLRDGLA